MIEGTEIDMLIPQEMIDIIEAVGMKMTIDAVEIMMIVTITDEGVEVEIDVMIIQVGGGMIEMTETDITTTNIEVITDAIETLMMIVEKEETMIIVKRIPTNQVTEITRKRKAIEAGQEVYRQHNQELSRP